MLNGCLQSRAIVFISHSSVSVFFKVPEACQDNFDSMTAAGLKGDDKVSTAGANSH